MPKKTTKIPKCIPSKVPIDLGVEPIINLCVSKPKINLSNYARCKCRSKSRSSSRGRCKSRSRSRSYSRCRCKSRSRSKSSSRGRSRSRSTSRGRTRYRICNNSRSSSNNSTMCKDNFSNGIKININIGTKQH